MTKNEKKNEENALVAFGGIPFSPAVLAKPKRNGKYLPRLQFNATGSCKLVAAGKVKVGNWSLTQSGETKDLGDTITVIPLVRLDKAVDRSSDEVEEAYAPSEKFDEIVDCVEEYGYKSNCMYGPYYLMFLVETEQFVELYLTSTSGRNEADNINLFLPVGAEAAKANDIEARPPRPATMGSKEITSKRKEKVGNKMVTKEYTYNVPTTGEGPKTLNVENPPTSEEIIERCNKFVDQTKEEVLEEENRDR